MDEYARMKPPTTIDASPIKLKVGWINGMVSTVTSTDNSQTDIVDPIGQLMQADMGWVCDGAQWDGGPHQYDKLRSYHVCTSDVSGVVDYDKVVSDYIARWN